MRTIERRLAHIEAITNPVAGVHCCFAEDDEDDHAAIKRRWPKGAPRGRVLCFRWLAPDAQ